MYTKDDFISVWRCIARSGADRMLTWLESTDFFTAPASTRFHGSCEGGLVNHSVCVFNRLCMLLDSVPGAPVVSAESRAICALLHDVCKANFYSSEMRNRKNANGQWEKYPFYIVNDRFPYGHGEKSVFLVERFMRLSTEEAVAIRFHMGAFDESTRNAFGSSVEKYPLSLYLHTADMMASNWDEAED
ncbi:MAG: hydrolase, partial [Gemmiger sp.]